MWFVKNGTAVPASNTIFELNKQPSTFGAAAGTINYFINLNSGSNVQLMWIANNSNGLLFASGSVTSPAKPSIPSVIMTVNQVG